jgi:hypothetical protein
VTREQEAWIPLGVAALLVCLGVSTGLAATEAPAVKPVAAATSGKACTDSCQKSYAQCYKSSGSNRKVCDAQLQQCLNGCIGAR